MRKLLIPIAALLLSTGCTAQARRLVAAAVDDPPVAASVTGTVTCTTVDLVAVGYPASTQFTVAVDSEPPYGFTFGHADPWGRAIEADGTITAHYEQSGFTASHDHDVLVYRDDPGSSTQVFTASVVCS